MTDFKWIKQQQKNGDFKYLPRRTTPGKVLGDKAFLIASNQQYDGYHRRLALMIYKFFDKKSRGAASHKGIRIRISDD